MDFIPGVEIVFEGYLYNAPLDKLLVNWKKRWFVLTKTTVSQNLATLDLSYYSDPTKKDKKGTVDLSKIVTVNPLPNKSKEHVFSIETSDRKYGFKAPDIQTREIWVAKLMEMCGKDDALFHVTVPFQSASSQCEGILMLNTPSCVTIAPPTSNASPIMEIPFAQIRRFGCRVAYDSDLLWFETCDCKLSESDFHFMSVASGIEKAYQIVQELKRNIECTTRSFLIMEESDETAWTYTYIARKHYGCSPFSTVARDRMLQAGLMSLYSSYGAMQLCQMNRFRKRSMPWTSIQQPSEDRRHTVATVSTAQKSPAHSPSASPAPSSPTVSSPPPLLPRGRSPSPCPSGHVALSQLQHRPPRRSCEEFDSGIAVDHIDHSRHSAPSYLPVPNQAQSSNHKKATLEQFQLNHSYDEASYRKLSPASPRRVTLAELRLQDGIENSHPRSRQAGKDSTIGTSADSYFEAKKPGVTSRYQYDHLPAKKSGGMSQYQYDHLPAVSSHQGYDRLPRTHRHASPSVLPRSLKSLGMESPYTEG